MDELFQQIEQRLRAFIVNTQQHQALLAREKELLSAKNKIAISQIENMVARLKSIEKQA
jgi:hypothetical protein